MSDLSDWSLVAATIGLVFATVVLGIFTWLLWRASRESLRRQYWEKRYRRLALKVEYGQRVVRDGLDAALPGVQKSGAREWYQGLTRPPAKSIRRLARLLDYSEDLQLIGEKGKVVELPAGITKMIEEILDDMDHGSNIDADNMEAKYFVYLRQLRDALHTQLIPWWRTEMDMFNQGVEVPEDAPEYP